MGKKNGDSYKYYSGEKPSEYIQYQNDTKYGKWEQYFETGQKRLTGSYASDLLSGSFISYNPDGSISITGNYTNGVMDGKWTYFSETGEPDLTVEYKNGSMLPNADMDKKVEEFSKKVKSVIGNLDETELPRIE
jgi:antitoxin component YwqK of YwqJK toxin-antitoxin module